MMSNVHFCKMVSNIRHFSMHHWRASMCILPKVNVASIRLYSGTAHCCEAYKAQTPQIAGLNVKQGGVDIHTRIERNAKKLRSAVIKSLQTDIKVSTLK